MKSAQSNDEEDLNVVNLEESVEVESDIHISPFAIALDNLMDNSI